MRGASLQLTLFQDCFQQLSESFGDELPAS
jgi:hypothetical protein